MRRDVQLNLTLDSEGDARAVLAVAVAAGHAVDEELTVVADGVDLPVTEILDDHGTRLHSVDVTRGAVEVTYRATVDGRAEPAAPTDVDPIRYLRPSRYCESDTLLPTAQEAIGERSGHDLVDAVAAWVGEHLAYVSGSSISTDGAVATLLARQGVCRDFAHVTAAMLRGLDLPARVVSVYAPGLSPMDMHAVAEALVDGQWWVIDPTGLAPRQSMVRIATGRDAADTAFLTTIGDPVTLDTMEVTAVVDELPRDAGNQRLQLG